MKRRERSIEDEMVRRSRHERTREAAELGTGFRSAHAVGVTGRRSATRGSCGRVRKTLAEEAVKQIESGFMRITAAAREVCV